jgi:hypothetical protein
MRFLGLQEFMFDEEMFNTLGPYWKDAIGLEYHDWWKGVLHDTVEGVFYGDLDPGINEIKNLSLK